ncbi:SpoIIE family protein phosphatase [Nocardioides guangzhouensis]|uniref:SpoIIE family protein phosphatase n=1 Tax=Nocardioides guangzhouensis TaxID=2497878 RepID=UPI001C378028|nr:SpoIIE family protein phosphatase [Nocardioides guangzhouensis]
MAPETGQTASRSSSGAAALLSRREPVAYAAALLVLAATYYIGARVGLTLSLVEQNVTPLWPPTGIAVAAFLLGGRRLWPAVTLAAFAVNLPISATLVAAAVTAVGNTLAPLVAVVLLDRVGFRRQLDRHRDALSIVFLGALASMTVSATVGAGTLAASDAITTDQLPSAWAVWWTGDAMGVLAVAPFLLCLPLFGELPDWSPARWLEGASILVLAAGTTAWAASSDVQMLFLVLPLLGWAAWRLQLRGAAPAALVVSLVVTWSAAREHGPFAHGTLFEQMFTLQSFNACVALTSLFLAALVSERNRSAAELAGAASELEDRVQRRTAELSAANQRLLQEIHERSEAQEQLSQEEARTRREHEIAATLQRSLLPDRIPQVPGVAVAARYVPATGDMSVGGDWYDVIQLPDGAVGLAIGDVAGHGLSAAATMGQVRMALRAYAVQDPSPVAVMTGVHHLVSNLPTSVMVTVTYLVLDPGTRTLRFTNAGHPPPLLFGGGESTYLEDGLSPPLGVTPDPTFTEVTHEVPAGATLVLYTDGLVERRRVSIQEGLDRLVVESAGREGSDVDVLCDHLLTALVDRDNVADDIALVAVRPAAPVDGPLELVLPAESRMLVQARRALRQWLRDSGVTAEDEGDVLLASGEACANVVRHAYAAAPGEMRLHATLHGDDLEVTVIDTGQWRAPADRGGGWGLQLMQGLMDDVDVDRTARGTVVRMRRRLRGGTA